MTKHIELYVNLLEEGTDTIRLTYAIPLGNGLYKLLPADDYDPEDEVWEFLPGSTVRAIPIKTFDGEPVLLAIEEAAQ